ncbi:hypothetical protein KCV07_g1479, partial [Aureobasidium melanogenum]
MSLPNGLDLLGEMSEACAIVLVGFLQLVHGLVHLFKSGLHVVYLKSSTSGAIDVGGGVSVGGVAAASALQAFETKNVKFEIVLGKLLIANDQAQGHLHHAFTRQQQMGQAIKDLQKDILENKKAIKDLKKQQVAAVSTPSKSRISSLQSLSGGILGAQTSILSDKSPFDTEG